MVHTIDLDFQGRTGTIASFLIETADGPILVESGPHSTLNALESGVQALGYQLSEIRHVFLTHIHLDHAGAAWALAARDKGGSADTTVCSDWARRRWPGQSESYIVEEIVRFCQSDYHGKSFAGRGMERRQHA